MTCTIRDGHATGGAVWEPILEGALAERAWRAILDIALSLARPGPRAPTQAGVAGGASGLALLYAALARADASGHARRFALEWLDRAIVSLLTEHLGADLFSGFSGVAFAAEQVERLLELPSEDRCEEIDRTVLAVSCTRPWPGHFDLVSGLAGVGIYALERSPRELATLCLEAIVDRLGERARIEPAGVTWLTRPEHLSAEGRARSPRGHFDLGLAHGVPGVIAFLSRALGRGISPETTRPLLHGAVRWLLARRSVGLSRGASFAPMLDLDGGPPGPASRSAWCYGDPGIAAALLVAARCAGESAWEDAAVDIALGAADRPPEECGVRDAGLCHGAAGLALVFNRLYQATGEPRLRDAATGWIARTLDMRDEDHGVAGFRAFLPPSLEAERGTMDATLLEGAAGIALSLLAAAATMEPTWDRLLAISHAPEERS